jgi:hypothetical protein
MEASALRDLGKRFISVNFLLQFYRRRAQWRGNDDAPEDPKFQAPTSREAPSSKLQYRANNG